VRCKELRVSGAGLEGLQRAAFVAEITAMLENSDLARCPPDQGWAAVRRATRRSDHVLTTSARTWVRRLPPRRRPLGLCAAFPRVANRLAWCWADAAVSAQVLDDLLIDRRGGRQGFPPLVVRELQRLRDYAMPR
jgi:hypothetical protein